MLGLGYNLMTPQFFSPDERYLYYQNRGISDGCGIFSGPPLERVDLLTGTTQGLPTFGADPALSPDGTTIALMRNPADEPDQIILYSLATGEERVIELMLTGEAPSAGGTFWSADGSQVAFVFAENICGENWHVGTVDLQTEEITLYPLDPGRNRYGFYFPTGWQADTVELQNWQGFRVYLDLGTGAVSAEPPPE